MEDLKNKAMGGALSAYVGIDSASQLVLSDSLMTHVANTSPEAASAVALAGFGGSMIYAYTRFGDAISKR